MNKEHDPDQPITYEEVVAACTRIRPHLSETPLRHYLPLDAAVGHGIRVFVKHEGHNPTNAFKVRNALSVLTTMKKDELSRGVVAASRGNYGLGLAWAGHRLGAPVTICVPEGNNSEKNEAMEGLGATLVIEGKDYDASLVVAQRLSEQRGLRFVHGTNNTEVLAGAGTITLEILEQHPDLEALVVAVGGGSQAVGAMTVARHRQPSMEVFAVQSERASTIHDSWHAGQAIETRIADTFADGLATRSTYAMTFPSLQAGLAGFITVSEQEIASALRLLLRSTHTLAEGAGAAGLAGLVKLSEKLAGKSVAIIISGANIDEATLRSVLNKQL